MKRTTPIKRVNPKRKAKRYERNFGDHAGWIRTLPCDDCGRRGPSAPSHARRRGAGGDKRAPRPQCRPCHMLYGEGKGISRELAMNRAAGYWARSPFNTDAP